MSWTPKTIFTLGHSNRTFEDFLHLLKTYDIRQLVDIRTIPRSRHNPQFNDTELAQALLPHHIAYIPMKELGGLRKPHKNSVNTGWRNDGFRGFADYMQTPDFARGLEALIQLSHTKRTAIMCAEAVPWRCHRSLVSDALIIRDIPVVEVLSNRDFRMHKLTPFAHVEKMRITYPPEQPALL